MSDVKLSRAKLEAALERWEANGLAQGRYGDMEQLANATRALLRVMEPASDGTAHTSADLDAAKWSCYSDAGWRNRYCTAHVDGYRAAEARARRLAHWSTE